MIAADVGEAISLRDEFAFSAMSAMLSFKGTERKPAVLAKNAYALADAMMRARGAAGPVTLRDHLAEMAMNGLVSGEGVSVKMDLSARIAFELADGMLAARAAGGVQ